jgi:DNA-binding CsgD family transcriptional regulator
MQNLTFGLKNILLHELQSVKGYGVDEIGYRYFLEDGRSNGLTTGGSYCKKNKDEAFYKVMNPFLSQELLDLQREKNRYVSRLENKENLEYMDILKTMNMHNSTGVYTFGEKRIDSFFYIYKDHCGAKRDLVLNNLPSVAGHTNNMLYKIMNLEEQIRINDNYEFILDDLTKNQLFKRDFKTNHFKQCVRVHIQGKLVELTEKEVELIMVLKYSFSNKGLAKILGISISTVEKHLHKIRLKLHLFTREDLLRFSHSLPIINSH